MKPFTELEDQIRECYGRVVFTYKTHEKMADQAANKLKCYKRLEIILAAITTSGILAINVSVDSPLLKTATAVVSLITLYVTAYVKEFDLGALAQRHRDAAAKIWFIRESYLSLLTDLRTAAIPDADARRVRDELQIKLGDTYQSSPQSNGDAYAAAQHALKKLEDHTFSKEEINAFLPESLKKP